MSGRMRFAGLNGRFRVEGVGSRDFEIWGLGCRNFGLGMPGLKIWGLGFSV